MVALPSAPVFGSDLAGAAPGLPRLPNGHHASASSSSVASSRHTPSSEGTIKAAFDLSAITDHLNHMFVHSEFSDVQLIVLFNTGEQTELLFNLHAVVISRSPLLRVLLQQSYAHRSSAQLHLTLPIHSPRITPAGVHLCIAALYSPAVLAHLSPLNASSVLATAAFFGLHAVAEYALELALGVVAQLSRPDEFQAWERFVGFGEGGLAQHIGKANGAGGVNGFPGAIADGFEPFGVRILQALLDRVPRLARELGAFGREPGRNTKDDEDAQDALTEVFAVLSFASFKQALEGPDFPALSDMDRFQYAKKCVAVRKRIGPSDFEEAVVLQFGQAPGATAVSVLRKARRPQLWKASG